LGEIFFKISSGHPAIRSRCRPSGQIAVKLQDLDNPRTYNRIRPISTTSLLEQCDTIGRNFAFGIFFPTYQN
jgi:hypothetical protein